MLSIGETKLRLDDAVGGDEIALDSTDGAGKDDQTAKEVRRSLLTTLRNKFDAAPEAEANGHKAEEGAVAVEETPTKRVARGSLRDDGPGAGESSQIVEETV